MSEDEEIARIRCVDGRRLMASRFGTVVEGRVRFRFRGDPRDGNVVERRWSYTVEWDDGKKETHLSPDELKFPRLLTETDNRPIFEVPIPRDYVTEIAAILAEAVSGNYYLDPYMRLTQSESRRAVAEAIVSLLEGPRPDEGGDDVDTIRIPGEGQRVDS